MLSLATSSFAFSAPTVVPRATLSMAAIEPEMPQVPETPVPLISTIRVGDKGERELMFWRSKTRCSTSAEWMELHIPRGADLTGHFDVEGAEYVLMRHLMLRGQA